MDRSKFWRLLNCVLFGLASGLPLLTTGSTLQAWLKNEGVQIETIGLFALVGVPYSYKFFWSPLLDRFDLFGIGRRRSWISTTQVLLILLLLLISFLDPAQHLWEMAILALVISFASATQDIALDAYRREILKDEELGLGSSLFVAGYRLGLLVSGALSLYLSSFLPWGVVYILLAAWMVLGLAVTIFSPEPTPHDGAPRTLSASFIEPLKNFFGRPYAWEILLFVLLYKLGDALASTMTTPFILDIGFSNSDLGLVGKTFGLGSAIVGGIIGGVLIPRFGLFRALVWFGILQGISTISFSYLAVLGPKMWALAATISFENITGGMGTAAFLAFLAQLCDRRYSATQYAVLSSIVAVPRTMFAAGTGFVAKAYGWELFFLFCTCAAIPGLILLYRAPRWKSFE